MRFLLVVSMLSVALAGGCGDAGVPKGSYYEQEIGPVFEFGCQQQLTGCHTASDEGTAAGNLDLSSYDSLMRREDALPAYGPYPLGLLLMKVSDPVEVSVETLDPDAPAIVRTDIRHNAGPGVALGSQAFATLKRWIADGHTRTGVPPREPADNEGGCVSGPGRAPGFDPEAAPVDGAAFERFVDEVQPMLRERCAGSSCHGAALADLHLSCGDTEAERRWNFFIAVAHLTDPPESSELLRRPLASARGGTYHGGGDTFADESDEGYQALLGWAESVVARTPEAVREEDPSDGYRFFVNRVQPTLVRKGCMFLNCHSPISLKLNLRGGSQGTFSRFARQRNYAIAKKNLALESPDPSQSRLVAKNLFPPEQVEGGAGIIHRGGSLLEDFSGGGEVSPASPDDCEGWDADTGDLNEVPAYCVLARWHEIERSEAIERGEILPEDEVVRGVVWVARPPGMGDPTTFDRYRPGADLRRADATVDPDGGLTLGDSRSLLGGCGLDPATTDVRHPTVSWRGERIAFAAREAADARWRLYWMDADGGGCEPIVGLAPERERQNGILAHDLDPAFAPDGRLVFASTRGNLAPGSYDYTGPTRTPARMQPNANLYVYEAGVEPAVRQLTFLLNQELQPGFMQDGRVIFTAEKREPGFHHLALRRQNLDGGDYHPLYAQRPTLGCETATEVEQLPNGNFVFVASTLEAEDGAGSIAVFNRSIGPDQQDRPEDDRAYLSSMRVPAPGVPGGMPGVYRSPAPLPTGRILVSCDEDAMVMDGGHDFDLCELDPQSGALRAVAGEPGVAEIEAVAIYARPDRGVLVSDGAGIDRPEIVSGERDAVVLWNDFPMIASLMFENTREGRPIDPRIEAFEVVETLPPPPGASRFDDLGAFLYEDEHGPMYLADRSLGTVPLYGDGSAKMRVPGGTPLRFRLLGGGGEPLLFPEDAPFEGEMIQREQEQYYPGERITRSIPRRFFNAVCGGCHGSISSRELDVAVDVDVVSGASRTAAKGASPVDLFAPPEERPAPEGR